MGIKNQPLINQIKRLLEERYNLKSSFGWTRYPAVVKDDNEIAKINKFMTKSKALVSKYLDLESEYYK